jgi:hypothetical protein
MMFLSFNSNTGVTSGAGTVNLSVAFVFTPVFNGGRVAQTLVFCVVYAHCLSLDLQLSIPPLVFSNTSYCIVNFN